jgi:hypothetical protein
MRGRLRAASMAGAVACAAITLATGCSSSPPAAAGGPVRPSVTAGVPAGSAVAATVPPGQSPSHGARATIPAAASHLATTPAAAAGGQCAAARLALGAQEPGTLFTSGGTATVSVTQYVRNTGGACTLRLPATIEVAGPAGSFVAAAVSASGGSGSQDIGAGQTIALALGSWWPSDGHKLVPSSSSSWCKAPVTNVTSVQIPLATGSLQFRLGDTFLGVCQSPSTLALVLNPG